MNLGFSEMLFIFFLALLIFGPKKLPEIGRQIAEAMLQFKRASNEFRSQLEDEIRNIEVEEQRKKISPPASPAPEPPALASVPRENPATPFSPHGESTAPSNGGGEHLTVPPEKDEGRNVV